MLCLLKNWFCEKLKSLFFHGHAFGKTSSLLADGGEGTIYFVLLKQQQWNKHPTVLKNTHERGHYCKMDLFNFLVFSEIPMWLPNSVKCCAACVKCLFVVNLIMVGPEMDLWSSVVLIYTSFFIITKNVPFWN